MRRVWVTFPLLSLLASCASGEPEAEYPETSVLVPEGTEEEEAVNREPARPAPPAGSLWRDEVNATVEAGLGWFLQRLEVEPVAEGGAFRGFRIVTLKTPDFWQGVDLRPGDVVVSVNGMPIERDIQAFEAFEALKKAPELRVKLLRGGRARELVYRIVEPPPEATATEPRAKPSSG